MNEAVKLFERDVELFIPWNTPHPEFKCKPYNVTVYTETKPIQDSEGQRHKCFFVIQLRCPLGTQNLAVLELPADSDLFDYDLPVKLDVNGWVEHAMCGSCLCKPAQIFMDARRRNKPEKFKQDWMFFEVHAARPKCKRPSPKTEDTLDGDNNLQEKNCSSGELTDYIQIETNNKETRDLFLKFADLLKDVANPESWKVVFKQASVPSGDDNGTQGK